MEDDRAQRAQLNDAPRSSVLQFWYPLACPDGMEQIVVQVRFVKWPWWNSPQYDLPDLQGRLGRRGKIDGGWILKSSLLFL